MAAADSFREVRPAGEDADLPDNIAGRVGGNSRMEGNALQVGHRVAEAELEGPRGVEGADHRDEEACILRHRVCCSYHCLVDMDSRR